MIKIINNSMTSNFDSDNSLLFFRDCNGSITSDRFKGDNEYEKKDKNILAKIPSDHFQAKNPRGLCAGLIYNTTKISDINISQKTIAKACYVSEPTLRMI
jgi:hypothetical protein